MSNDKNLAYAEILAKMIRHETISRRGSYDKSKFDSFHELLKELFPNIHRACELEEFEGSLLFRWPAGVESDKEPILLMSHHDVVEASGQWTYPAFSGEIAEGKLWGRGTLDTKGSLWAILQATEELIEEGFTPDRDIYIESSCDEETAGLGADMISKELHRRGIRFYLVLDEGGMILYDPIGGADGNFAMVGVGEKSFVDLKFTAHSSGGHASAPGKDTPLVRLGKFMAEVDRVCPFETRLSPVVKEMFRRFAPFMKGALKPVFGNVKIFGWLLKRVMPKISANAGAMISTTLAFTMASGSEGSNVLPQEAWVVGNMRCSHHQGSDKSIRAVKAIADKYDIETEILERGIDSPLSDYNTEAFAFVEKAVENVFENVKTVPYVMNGASDCRYMSRVSDNCFRFAPFLISDSQLDSIHGIDENVDLCTLTTAVEFYRYIIKEIKK